MYGGIVLNRPNGGINVAAVEFMATQVKGAPGKVVWMPAGDTESEVKSSRQPNRPFVSVTRAGEVLPEVKEIISLIAKHNLVLASGHILAVDALRSSPVQGTGWRRCTNAALPTVSSTS